MADSITPQQQPLFVQGNYVDNPSDAVANQAVAEGLASFPQGVRVPVISPTGVKGTIPSEAAQDALRAGYKLQPIEMQRADALQARYGTGLEQAKTFGEHALSTATFGLSSQLQTGLGISNPEDLRYRSEANPKVGFAGDVTGVVAPLLIPGPNLVKGVGALGDFAAGATAKALGVAGKAAETIGPTRTATEVGTELLGKLKGFGSALVKDPVAAGQMAEGALSKAGTGLANFARESLAPSVLAGKGIARGVGGALEGALYGAGRVLDQDAKGDVGLTAESAFSEIFSSAMLGGTLAGLTGVVLPKIKVGKMPALPEGTPGLWAMLDSGTDIAGGMSGLSMLAGGLPAGPAGIALGALAMKFAADGYKALPRALEIVNKFGAVQQRVSRELGVGIRALLHGAQVNALDIKKAFDAKAAREEYEKRTNYLRYLNGNPEMFHQTLTRQFGPYQDLLPNTATGMNMVASRAISYLAGHIPQHDLPGPLAPKYQPATSEIASFNRIWNAVENPLSILNDAATGALDPLAVSAVAQTYPSFYGELETQLLDHLTEAKDIPYRARQSIGMLLGQDVDGSTVPQAIQASQAVYGPPMNIGVHPVPPPKPRARPAAAGKMTLASRMETQVQRMEGK